MTAFDDAAAHALDGHFGRRQPQEEQMKVIPACCQLPNPRRERLARQRRLEREIDTLAASSLSRASMSRPAASATDSGRYAHSPRAMSSALTKSWMPSVSRIRIG